MDHRRIEAENVPERYARGKLSREDAAEFEQHLMQCPSCLERVESTERLLQGLRQLAADEESWSGERRASAETTNDRAGSKRLVLGLAAALAVLLLGSLIVKLLEVDRLRNELAQTRTELEAVQKADGERRAAQHDAIQAARREALEEQRRVEEELAAERRRHEELRSWLASAERPQADAPVFSLSLDRDAAASPREIELPLTPGWIVLSLDPGSLPGSSFRASLRTADGDTLWTLSDLQPDYRGLLNLSVHSSTLPLGDHRLTLETSPASVETVAALRFSQAPG